MYTVKGQKAGELYSLIALVDIFFVPIMQWERAGTLQLCVCFRGACL